MRHRPVFASVVLVQMPIDVPPYASKNWPSASKHAWVADCHVDAALLMAVFSLRTPLFSLRLTPCFCFSHTAGFAPSLFEVCPSSVFNSPKAFCKLHSHALAAVIISARTSIHSITTITNAQAWLSMSRTFYKLSVRCNTILHRWCLTFRTIINDEVEGIRNVKVLQKEILWTISSTPAVYRYETTSLFTSGTKIGGIECSSCSS